MSFRVLPMLCLASLASGCFYMNANLAQEKGGAYKQYPASVEQEQARRAKRRRTALIASPLEILGGAGLTALALFAKSSPMNDGDDSITDNLGDAGKEIAGRILLASIGGAMVLGGAGDLLLGLTDPLHRSPLVRDGALVGADRIDTIEPLHAPRLTFHTGTVIGSQSLGADLGLGLAHWLDDRFRLRHSVAGSYRNAWKHETQGGVTAETHAEWAFGRKRAGLSPRKAIGIYGGAGWWWTPEQGAPTAIGGLSFEMAGVENRLGIRYVHGGERIPSVDFSMQLELGGD